MLFVVNMMRDYNTLRCSFAVLAFAAVAIQPGSAKSKETVDGRFVQMAVEQLNSKHCKEAINYADEAIKANPRNADAYLVRAKAYFERRPDKALIDAKKCLEINPKIADAHLVRAKSLFMLESDSKEAFAELKTALELNPKIEGAYDFLGIGYASQKDYGKALECFSKAIAVNPEDRKQFFHRATVYEALGRDDKAIQDYSTVIKKWPGDKHAHEKRAGAYEHCGQLEKAYADLTEAVHRSKDAGKYLDRRARVLSRLKRHRESIDDYSRLLSQNDLDFDIYRLRGDEYMAIKDYANAIHDYDEAVKLAPQVAILHEKRARALDFLGQSKNAAEERAKAMRLRSGPAEKKL